MSPVFYIVVGVWVISFFLFSIWKESKGNADSDWWKNIPPDKWKWYGYYNKDDKRLFIWGRKYGIGWSINNANPYAILVYGGMVLFIWLATLCSKS